ncbi:signal peptidase I [Patescibacteria group bacterium]|nr:signal peptidase I [Patescibacteria group bacterium]MBU1683032.1 signal peptidase I [Patescibacteria group bacterium]MBU1935267.1 signal peptidase I [Patescibacteria group bacterium]
MKEEAAKPESGTKKFLKEVGLFLADILYNAVIIIILVVLIRSFLISPFRVIGSSMADTLQSNEFILIDKLSYNIGEPDRGDPIVFKPPITSKYPHKFEEAVTTDENGVGILDISELKTNKDVVYCQNQFVKKLWFCKDAVNENDLIYFQPIQQDRWNNTESSWKNAKERTVTQEEIENEQIIIEGEANQSYSIRIYSSNGPEYFVKRIIGIPGDTIKIENGIVYLKTAESEDFIELGEDYLNQENQDHTYFNQKLSSNTFIVPEEYYFVLGDNRNHSNDSRSWFAPINQEHTPYVYTEDISGKVLVVLWPLTDIRFISSGNL